MRVLSALCFMLCLWSSFAQAAVLPIVEVTSPSGIKAWLVEDHNLPLISVSFSFKGGVETDPAEKQGLMTLMSSLLTQGAGPYKEKEFQQHLAANSIALSFSAQRDYLRGSLKTLRRQEAKAFTLLKYALISPRFDQADLDRVRQQQVASLRYQMSNPSWQGRYALYKNIYGQHPYSYRSLGTQESLTKITRKDIQSFSVNHLTRSGLEIAVVGAISPEELGMRLDQAFGALPEKGTCLPVKSFQWSREPEKILVERDGAQTTVLFMAPMMRRKNADWYAAQLANYVLGGGSFNSRLMQVVRAKEGLTYGIGTGMAPMERDSLLLGNFSTDNTKAKRALGLVQDVWQKFYDDGITEEELKAAQDYLIGTMALSLTSTDAISSVLLSMLNEDLGIDYLDRRSGFYRAVSLKEIQRVIKEWFNPENVFFGFVGKPKNLSVDRQEKQVME